MYHVTELHNIQIGFLTEKLRLTAEQKLERVAMLEEINLYCINLASEKKTARTKRSHSHCTIFNVPSQNLGL
jgi:hypothetical protein